MPLAANDAMFLLVGVSIVLPLGARLAGDAPLAERLDAVPRLTFGAVCLAVAFLPEQIFGRGWDRSGTASVLAVRVVFSAMGSYLLAAALLRWRRARQDKGAAGSGGAPRTK